MRLISDKLLDHVRAAAWDIFCDWIDEQVVQLVAAVGSDHFELGGETREGFLSWRYALECREHGHRFNADSE